MTSGSDNATKKGKSRTAFRFTIRTVLILMTALAVFLAHRTHIARREAPALKLVREHGCTPLYRHDIFGNLPSFAPQVIRETVGIENFGSVVRLNFASGQPRSDEAFAMLDRLPNVTVLNTDGTSLTNAGLAPIANLKSLTCLRLENAKNISDEGLQHLSGLNNLDMLNLRGTGVTDAGLVHLKGLTNLQYLSLGQTAITDEGIRHLEGLTDLEYLQLQKTSVTEKAVQEFRRTHPGCQVVHDS